MLVIRGEVRGVDEYVIEVDHDAHIQHIYEDTVDKTLECSGSVSETKGHYQPLKGVIAGVEGGLPFISIGNADQIIHMSEIKFAIDLSSTWGFKQVRGQGKWISVLFHDLV